MTTKSQKLAERNRLVVLINTYNDATNPAVCRTDEEHQIERVKARSALASIRRHYAEGQDYRELSNGALWPLEAK